MFTSHRDFADLTPTQYEAAYAWLQSSGLLEDLATGIPIAQRVFHSAFDPSETPWLKDADVLIRTPEDLPEDALLTAEALGLSRSEAFGQLTTLWGKVDTEERARVGVAGERALVKLLEHSLHATVDHVAEHWDGLGYDIEVSGPQMSALLEVKSTSRLARLVFYLSRNEFETMLREPAWNLVVIRLDSNLEIIKLAVVPNDWIAAQAARDFGSYGRWESCRFDVPTDLLQPGMPFLRPVLKSSASPLLTKGVS